MASLPPPKKVIVAHLSLNNCQTPFSSRLIEGGKGAGQEESSKAELPVSLLPQRNVLTFYDQFPYSKFVAFLSSNFDTALKECQILSSFDILPVGNTGGEGWGGFDGILVRKTGRGSLLNFDFRKLLPPPPPPPPFLPAARAQTFCFAPQGQK